MRSRYSISSILKCCIRAVAVALILSALGGAALFLAVKPAHCDSVTGPVLGYDHLALLNPKYDLDKVIEKLPNESGVGFLWRTFGTDLDRVRTVLRSGKVRLLRVHLINGPGMRNSRLQENEKFFTVSVQEFRNRINRRDANTLSIIHDEAAAVCEALAKEFLEIKVLCSPILEHNLSDSEFNIVAAEVERAAPNATIVNNPVRRLTTAVGGNYLLELHGSPRVLAQIISRDGEEKQSTPDDYFRKFPGAQIVLWWEKSMNCVEEGSWIAPLSRSTCWSQ